MKEDLSTTHVKLILIHVELSHPEEITIYMFMVSVLHIFNHPVAFYITDDILFEIPRMLSGSYELQDYFQVLV